MEICANLEPRVVHLECRTFDPCDKISKIQFPSFFSSDNQLVYLEKKKNERKVN
jgi:hypothetical protein